MARSLSEYYGSAKSGIRSISMAQAEKLGEDMAVAAGAGAAIGLLAGAVGGLDHTVAGFKIPVDGAVGLGLGLASLKVSGGVGHALKVASIAATGSAAVRTFETFFAKSFPPKVKGDFEDIGMSLPWGNAQFSFGQQDRLVEAAKYL